ncbi:hypothetical protein [Paenibacillus piscarius]|uniref:hypothetical protein n=1 Tax=Paenibacillus piscarius TaxID=1089681 RepID=UPI001EE86390|nr:hypothetical protein [Paenibacillus piscarius]
MEKHEIFMKGYLGKCLKITFLDNLYVTGTYVDYYYANNVIVILPEDKGEDAWLFIPLSAIKTIARWFY